MMATPSVPGSTILCTCRITKSPSTNTRLVSLCDRGDFWPRGVQSRLVERKHDLLVNFFLRCMHARALHHFTAVPTISALPNKESAREPAPGRILRSLHGHLVQYRIRGARRLGEPACGRAPVPSHRL